MHTVRLPWTRSPGAHTPAGVERRAFVGPEISIGDPALAEFMGLNGQNDAGIILTDRSALGFTAYYRAVEIVAGTIGTLPMPTYRDTDERMPDGSARRERVASFLDSPGGAWLTPFEWKHLVIVHLMTRGNAYLLHIYNMAGAIVGLFPIAPGLVTPRWGQLKDEFGRPVGEHRRLYDCNIDGRSITYTSEDLTHVMGLTLDGVCGESPISLMRNALATGIAGDLAAAKMFSNGLLLGGILSSNEMLTPEQGDQIKAGLKARVGGANNAGDIAVINASLTFSPWTMTGEDAQFLESREHQIEEVARMTGVPPFLLGQMSAQTSWGTGILEQQRGLAKYTLSRWTTPLEERLSMLLASPRFTEFSYKALVEPTPEIEIPLVLAQVNGGLITANEGRGILNLPPIAGGDTLRMPSSTAPAAAPFDPNA